MRRSQFKKIISTMNKRLAHGCGNHGCQIKPPRGQETNERLQAELEWNKMAATAEINRLRHELELIAKANPKAWEPDVRDQFREWAQNRANYCLEKFPLWP